MAENRSVSTDEILKANGRQKRKEGTGSSNC